MKYSIFFAIVLVLVSGFIAYFGDLLGRKMGKKRLTLFGIRPRYTAIVMTTITGMLIAGLTLVTLISINPEFKRIFNEGAEIFKRNKTLSVQNAHLEKKNVDLVSRSQNLEKEVAKQQQDLLKARNDVHKAQLAMTLAVKARDAAQKNILRLQLDIAQRQSELAKLKLKNDAAGKEIRLAAGQLKDVRNKLSEEQSKLKIAQMSLDTARGNLAVASANLHITEDKLAEAEKKLQEQDLALKSKDQDIKDQTAYLNDLIKRVNEAQALFNKSYDELRTSELILRQGEELVRGTISSSSSAFGVKADLKALLDAAGEKAELLGAKKGSAKRAVMVIFKQSIEGKNFTLDNEANCIDMATETILGSFSEAMVQVVCAGNTIAGEQVPVEFRLYRNSQVFRSGRLIASVRLDGDMSEGRILLAVIDFLRKDVSEAALRAGIIPVANPDPRVSMGKDSATQVDSLMALVVQIKNENARVKLEAYASDDIFAAGPLNMDNMRFKVTRLE